MYCVTVLFTLKPGAAERFVPLVRDNAAQSLLQEPGCHRFDVCHDPGQPDKLFLYELYEDRAAFEAHLGTAHFKAFDAASAGFVAEKQVSAYGRVWS